MRLQSSNFAQPNQRHHAGTVLSKNDVSQNRWNLVEDNSTHKHALPSGEQTETEFYDSAFPGGTDRRQSKFDDSNSKRGIFSFFKKRERVNKATNE